MRKIISILLTVVLLAALFTSCSSGPSNYIAVLFDDDSDAFATELKLVFSSEIKNKDNKYDAAIMTNSAKIDQSIQDDQLEVLCTQGIKALIVNPVDASSVSNILDKASKAELPVVLFDNEPDIETIKAYEGTVFVGATEQDKATAQGELIAKLWKENSQYDKNKDGKMQYAVIGGSADDAKTAIRTDGSVNAVKAAGINVEELSVQSADWDKTKAIEAAEKLISQMGDKVEFIICNDDNMAAGVVTALEKAGYNNSKDKYIPVVGIGATIEAKELIKRGSMDGTVGQNTTELGKALLKITMNLATGKEALDGTEYKFDDTGVVVRIDCVTCTGETITQEEANSSEEAK